MSDSKGESFNLCSNTTAWPSVNGKERGQSEAFPRRQCDGQRVHLQGTNCSHGRSEHLWATCFSFCGFCSYATGVGWLQKLNILRLIKILIQSDCQLYQFQVMVPPPLIICRAKNAQWKGCMKPCCWICCQLQLQRLFRLSAGYRSADKWRKVPC